MTVGRHAAKVAVLWPIQSMFATYTPQTHSASGERTEHDFNTLTDLLLRLRYDFDYLDEDILAGARIENGCIHVAEERYELLILPPIAYLKINTVSRLEEFVNAGGRLRGMIFLPDQAFSSAGVVNIVARMEALFGIDPVESQRDCADQIDLTVLEKTHSRGGTASFLRSYALARQLPWRLQEQLGRPGHPESPHFVIETVGDENRYFFEPATGKRQEISAEVESARTAVADAL